MVNYRAAKNKTVAIGRYQVTVDPGIDLETEDADLEALVKSGDLVKNAEVVEAPKSAQAVSTPSGTSK